MQYKVLYAIQVVLLTQLRYGVTTETEMEKAMSDWDDYEAASESREISRAVEQYEELCAKRDEIVEQIDLLSKQIISEFPEDFGEHSRIAGNKVVTINRSERYEWNQDLLGKIFREEEIPVHIKRRLTVDKRVFSRLSPDEQAPLVPALTRKPGPVSIKITRSD